MVRNLLWQGVESVLWVEPYPTRLPRLVDFTHRTRPSAHVSQPVSDEFEILPIKAFPLEPFPGGSFVNGLFAWRDVHARLRSFCSNDRCMLGIGKPSVLSLWALNNLTYASSFFDLMDDFPAFYSGVSRFSMARTMERVISRVDRVVCSCHPLWNMLGEDRNKAQIILNGYDMSSLPSGAATPDEEVIGYVGTIGKWFDWPLVVEIARALPHVIVRLVGPEFVPRPAKLPCNIEMVPQCSQTEAVEQVSRFRIGLIPFAQSELTASVDPIKYYEYRGMGLPVWSTKFGEMQRRRFEDGVVHIATGADWSSLYEKCKMFQMSEPELRAFRDENDWSVRFHNLAMNDVGRGH